MLAHARELNQSFPSRILTPAFLSANKACHPERP
jgi:hypothetical protein